MSAFFVASDAIVPPTVRIDGPLLHHLRQSLRLQPGETLTITDDRGVRYRTEILEVTHRVLIGRILETSTAPPTTSPSLVLAQSLLKGEKMDWVIQKATELGVDRITPILARQSIVRPRTERIEHQRVRWQRIALEAAQQSERWSVPAIDEPATVSQMLSCSQTAASKLLLVERAQGSPLRSLSLPDGNHDTVTILIGPEGGWAQEELRAATDHGFVTVTLGPRILRAETAAIAAVSVLQSRFGELG